MKYFFLFSFILMNYCNAQILKNEFDGKPIYFPKYLGSVKQVTNYYYITNYKAIDSTAKVDRFDTIYNTTFTLVGINCDSFNRTKNIVKSFSINKQKEKQLNLSYEYDSLINFTLISAFKKENKIASQTVFEYQNRKLINKKLYGEGNDLWVEDMYKYFSDDEIEKRTITKHNYEIARLKRNNNKIVNEVYNLKEELLMKEIEIEDDTSIYQKSEYYAKNYRYKIWENRIIKNSPFPYYSLLTKKKNGDYEQNFYAFETKYDEHKNITKLVLFDKLKKVNNVITAKYKYDIAGNITEQLITYADGSKEFRKYEFEYY